LGDIRATAVTTIPPKDPHFLDLTWARIAVLLDELIVHVEHPWQREQAAAGCTVERFLEQDVDVALGGDPPLALRGRPDRVELLRKDGRLTLVRVLDYKTKRDADDLGARLDPQKDLGRTSFQIPVYLLGALAGHPAGLDDETCFEGGYLV